MATINSFQDLIIFKEARDLAKQIFALTKDPPFVYDNRFVQQIRAASGSIMDNIAEGFEREGNKEFIHFLYIAKGSCAEVQSQIIRAYDCEHINKKQAQELYDKTKIITIGIKHLIDKLNSSDFKGFKYKDKTN